MEIILLELFSGAGGFAKGIEEAGFTIKKCFFSEVDKHAIANYKYNFKDAEYIGSVKSVRHIVRAVGEYRRNNPGIKLVLTFGSPCQDFSLAGQRGGLEGAKSSLIKYALFLVKWLRPDVFIWENVKGAYSTNAGADYWAITKAFADLDGYRHEQQLLNTSWFLPQNRERIYSVGYIADRCKPGIFPVGGADEICTRPRKIEEEVHTNNRLAITQQARQFSSWCGDFVIPSNTQQGYETAQQGDSINFSNPSSKTRRGRVGKGKAQTLDTSCNQGVISSGIRRLTEIECERLQGFPDDWTRYGIYTDKQGNETTKEIPRTQRYKLMGNAVTVAVVKEVAKRIKNNLNAEL